MDVSGKKAIVFGGRSGIGLATSKLLASMGTNVIAVSRDPSKAGELPVGVSLAKCDVLDCQALALLFELHAPFDILISAATGGSRAIE
ncbi:SDR family NAD(P)-dependent oxidoreductase [Shewanella phaeophyticola]|uniref:SDR family NAD(P)-dependent oxidoreductase n=1 Tax=Shewanella phaeophyticola TaxID=2978345 RepID=A0ABT2P3R3_9GAMM|nr:SDR family NAD(P)-dependent oxidoreductase [Shewanella sp. KJ10-1]MCT8986569.1 SDR family NAD(P)-dependent oxidoreductase [Shewanella sp. KJ10-1]